MANAFAGFNIKNNTTQRTGTQNAFSGFGAEETPYQQAVRRYNLQNDAGNEDDPGFFSGVTSGIAGVLGGQARFGEVNSPFGGETLGKAADYFEGIARDNARTKFTDGPELSLDYLQDPQGLRYDVGNTVGSGLALGAETAAAAAAVANSPLAAGAAAVGRALPWAAKLWNSPLGKVVVGNVAQTPLEAVSEGGNLVPELREAGYSEDEIQEIANRAAALNIGGLGLSNLIQSYGASRVLGLLRNTPGRMSVGEIAKRGALGAAGGGATNYFEEGMQSAIGDLAMGRPVDWQEAETSARTGGVTGAVLGGLGGTGGAYMQSRRAANQQEQQEGQEQPERDEKQAFIDAIAGQESGGNYNAVNERTGASGKYQIMPGNWPSWAEEAGLGRDAEMTPENQEIVARFKLGQYYDKYGARGAAIAWYGGEGALNYSDEALNRKQGNGNEPSINEYADSVMARMGRGDSSLRSYYADDAESSNAELPDVGVPMPEATAATPARGFRVEDIAAAEAEDYNTATQPKEPAYSRAEARSAADDYNSLIDEALDASEAAWQAPTQQTRARRLYNGLRLGTTGTSYNPAIAMQTPALDRARRQELNRRADELALENQRVAQEMAGRRRRFMGESTPSFHELMQRTKARREQETANDVLNNRRLENLTQRAMTGDHSARRTFSGLRPEVQRVLLNRHIDRLQVQNDEAQAEAARKMLREAEERQAEKDRVQRAQERAETAQAAEEYFRSSDEAPIDAVRREIRATREGIEQTLEPILDQLREGMGNGVALISGREGGRRTRMSQNAKWYQDFYAAHKRKPTKRELLDIAREVYTGRNSYGLPGWEVTQENESYFKENEASLNELDSYLEIYDELERKFLREPNGGIRNGENTVSEEYNNQNPEPQESQQAGESSEESQSAETENEVNKKTVSVEENISNGKKALQRVIDTHKDVENAMYRDDVGDIAFVWGTPGRGNNFKGGYGISHILQKHENSGAEIVNDIPEIIAKGEIAKKQEAPLGDRVTIAHGKKSVVLSLYKDGDRKTWLVTAWNNEQYEKRTAPNATGAVYDADDATASATTRSRRAGEEAVPVSSNVTQENEKVKTDNEQTSGNGAGAETQSKEAAVSDTVKEFADTFGLNVNKLNALVNSNRNESNINEWGNFDDLKADLDKNKAKQYFDAIEGTDVPMRRVNMLADDLMRRFIINKGKNFQKAPTANKANTPDGGRTQAEQQQDNETKQTPAQEEKTPQKADKSVDTAQRKVVNGDREGIPEIFSASEESWITDEGTRTQYNLRHPDGEYFARRMPDGMWEKYGIEKQIPLTQLSFKTAEGRRQFANDWVDGKVEDAKRSVEKAKEEERERREQEEARQQMLADMPEATFNLNEEQNGIEIKFASKPPEEVRRGLKNARYRWSTRNQLWYAKQTPEAMAFAESIGYVPENVVQSKQEAGDTTTQSEGGNSDVIHNAESNSQENNTNRTGDQNGRTSTESRPDSGDGQRSGEAGSEGRRDSSNNDVPDSRTVAGRTVDVSRSESELSGTDERDTGSAGLSGSVVDSYTGKPNANGTTTGKSIKAIADGRANEATQTVKQATSENEKQKAEKLQKVAADLPFLTQGQKEDVVFAETRLIDNNATGVMFTNGTGTGKTFSGLGIAKEMELKGKDNILVISPSAAVNKQWVEAADKFFDIKLTPLESTADAGTGAVITTYANAQANDALVGRNWDLIIADEAHNLMNNEQGNPTEALNRLRAMTYHNRGFEKRADILVATPEEKAAREEYRRLDKETDAYEKQHANIPAELSKRLEDARQKYMKLHQENAGARQEAIKKWEEIPKEDKPKTVFLSATPFAYDKDVDYAEGYLFEYSGDKKSGGYNVANAQQEFMMQHFGYRMRYNKLTRPDAQVDNRVMEVNFHEWLKKTGALSGRELEIDKDYNRGFILVNQGIGKKIDEGFDWLFKNRNRYSHLYDILNKQFGSRQRNYLIESIKARESIPIIKQYLKQGKKVALFHDAKKLRDLQHPFKLNVSNIKGSNAFEERSIAESEYQQFKKERPDLVNLNLNGLQSPIAIIEKAFGEDVMLFNGDVPKTRRNEYVRLFNDDNSGKNLIMVQSDAGNAGISLHDTTGKYQRVLINIGIPKRPSYAIQIEGRIYRQGSMSNAIIRYLSTGTNIEKYLFATTIAGRASTAENLAMGSKARGLRDSFINAFTETFDGTWEQRKPGAPGEDVGGKEADRGVLEDMSDFERAKALYYATQKKNSRNKGKEGIDYFATPEPVGYKMVEWAGLKDGDKVLEPSAGHGAISRFFSPNTENVIIEPSSELAPIAAMNTDNARLIEGMFEGYNTINKFDAVVMNPPFGTGGKTAMEHLEKAFKHLRHDGRVIAIVPNGPSMEKRLAKWFESDDSKEAYLRGEIILPGSAFERAGTKVGTKILIIDKHFGKRLENVSFKRLDFSRMESTEELFDAIENIDMPARFNERAVRYSAEDTAAETRSYEDLFAELQAALPNADFKFNDSGEIIAEMPNKACFKINIADRLIVNDAEVARARTEHALTSSNLNIAGSWQTIDTDYIDGVLSLSRTGKSGTADHEVMHAAMDLALTDKERSALLKHADKEAKASSKNIDEVIADGYVEWKAARARRSGTLFGKLYNKMQDMLHSLKKLLTGIDDAHSVMRRVASGEVWQQQRQNRTSSSARYSAEENTTPEQKAAQAFTNTERKTTWQSVKDWVQDKRKNLYVEWVDKNDSLHGLDEAIEMTTGIKTEGDKSVYNRAQTLPATAAGLANALIEGDANSVRAVNERLKNKKLPHNVTLQMVLHFVDRNKMDKAHPQYLKRGGFKNWIDAFGTYLGCARLNEMLLLHDAEYTQRVKEWEQRKAARERWEANGAIGVPPQEAIHQEWENFQKALNRAYRKWSDNGKTGPDPREKMRADWLVTHKTLEEPLKTVGKKPEYKPYLLPKGLTQADIESVIKNAPPEFKKAASMYYQFNDNMLTVMEDAGLISGETHKLLNTKYKYYCPLMRDFSDTAAADNFINGLSNGGRGIGNVSNPLKRISIEGSSRNVLNPLESTIKAVAVMCNRAERNKVGQLAVEMAEKGGLDAVIQKTEGTTADPNNCVFTVMYNGKKQAYKTTQELYSPIAGYNLPAAGFVLGIARNAARLLRAGATTSPSFIIRNLIRDTIFAGVSSKNGFVPIVDTIRGAYALARDPRLRADFKTAGVTQFNFYSSSEQIVKSLDEMAGGKPFSEYGAADIWRAIMKYPAFASEFIESSSRMGEFIKARKKGASLEEAAQAARELTLDFSRSGVQGEKVNQIVPFFNAVIQGSDKMVRLLKQDPVGTSTKLAMYIILPSLALWALNHDEDWYRELNPEIKATCWCLPGGIRIPKPQEAGILFGSGIEAALDQALNDDPAAIKNWAKVFGGNIAPNVMPTIFLPIIEWQANYSFFRGHSITPQRLQNLPDELQYTPNTSAAARTIGGVAGLSPVKIDNTIRGYTGTMGMLLVQQFDWLADDKQNMPYKKISEMPFLRDFTVNQNIQNRSLDDFYEMLHKANEQHAGYGKKGKPTAAVKGVRAAGKLISEAQKDIREITVNPRMSPEAKRARIDRKKEYIKNVARKANARFGRQFE